MLDKKTALEVLKVDEKVKNCPISLFKTNTIILYIGKCRKSKIVSAKGESWVGKDEVYSRQFGYVLDFILEDKEIHKPLQIGDVVYCDPFVGEIMPYEIGEELLYFKVVKKSEINIIIN
jgi:hypothetical protein